MSTQTTLTNPVIRHEQTGVRRFAIVLAIPLTLVAVVYFSVAMHSAIDRTLKPWPMTPWESAIVVDSWRAIHHQAVYTDPTKGHATLMYGPLGVYINVPLVAMFGPDVRLTRATSLGMALALSISAAWLLSRRGDWTTRLLIVSFCFLQFYRVRDWAVEARPDAALLLFSFASLILFYRSVHAPHSRSALQWVLLGTVVMLVGFFFKQTAAVVCVIPALIVLLTRPPGWLSRLTIAAIPIVAAIATVLALKAFWPWVYFYMIKVPGSYGVPLDGWFASVIELFRFSPLALAVFLAWVVMKRGERIDPINQWLLVTAVVTGLCGAAARAKLGGYYNSHLPAMIALAIFAARAIPEILKHLATTRPPQIQTVALAALVPFILIADIATITRTLFPGRSTPEHGDIHYRTVIEKVRSLDGRVVCPDDPSIPLLAKNFPGHSGQCELDANNQRMPITVRREIRSADWYVQVIDERRPMYAADELRNFGFEPSPGLMPDGSVYFLWKRSAPTTLPD